MRPVVLRGSAPVFATIFATACTDRSPAKVRGRVCYRFSMSDDRHGPRERLQIALQLAGLAEQMMEQNLRRADSDATDEEIEARLLEWLRTRPGAEHGDACGRPVPWPRVEP